MMTIKARLIWLILTAVIVLLLLFVAHTWVQVKASDNLHKVNQLSKDRALINLEGSLERLHIEYMFTLQHNPSAVDVFALHDHGIEQHYRKIEQEIETIHTNISAYRQSSAYLFNQELLAKLEQEVTAYTTNIKSGLELCQNKAFTQATAHLLKTLNPQLKQMLASNKVLREQITSQGHILEEESNDFIQYAESMMQLIGLIALLIMLLQGYFIIKMIMDSIKAINDHVTVSTQNMDFSTHLPPRKDELSLTVERLNYLFSQLKYSFEQANQVAAAFAAGQFGRRMDINLAGDMGELACNLNKSFEQAELSAQAVSSALTAIKLGQTLDEWSDKNKSFQGEWQTTVDMGASVLKGRAVLFSEINAVMANAAKGDFSTRVTMQTSGIYLVLKNSVNAAMDNLNAAISDVLRASDSLSKNNLTQLVEGNHHGDLEKLKVGMNTAIAALNQSFGLVRAQTQEVAISSTQVAQANNNLSKRIQEQAVALEETASAMEELTAQVYQSAQHASNASCLAKESQSHVQQGAAAMTEAIDAMDGIRLVSKQITGIITIIDSIAFQTNLLALNAAVEAARAGEHGRGFAVVASEVRSLAQKSADAAKEIKQLIDVTSAKINEGTQKVKTTGASLTMITGKFDQMVVLVEQITHNANEQAQGLGQTNTAIAKIDHAVQQGASAVQENASLAQYLGEVANNLDQMSARFQINQQLSALPVELDDESLPLALVVEDNLPSQKIAVALLKRQGYRVDTADSGRAAVELASRKSYTVILMDIEMRDGNGLNATEKLRQMGVTSTIIAVTATKGHLQATIDAGMDGFILKPITPQELEGVLVSIRR